MKTFLVYFTYNTDREEIQDSVFIDAKNKTLAMVAVQEKGITVTDAVEMR